FIYFFGQLSADGIVQVGDILLFGRVFSIAVLPANLFKSGMVALVPVGHASSRSNQFFIGNKIMRWVVIAILVYIDPDCPVIIRRQMPAMLTKHNRLTGTDTTHSLWVCF